MEEHRIIKEDQMLKKIAQGLKEGNTFQAQDVNEAGFKLTFIQEFAPSGQLLRTYLVDAERIVKQVQ